MAFVFYDTETTGISTDYDQILQFAAIHTNEDLEELDRIELRCRLHPHVVPHPGALRVTGMTIDRLLDASLPYHYEMVRQIRAKLSEWSPAVFVGYNSMRFDEHLLRQALFRTLHSPYLTNTGGNCRADALPLVQAAAEFLPGSVAVPVGDNGKVSYKLDRLAPANGFAHANAHDALADVEATIHMARCVRERAPESWSRFLRFATKAAAASFVDEEEAFVLSEFYFNLPYHFALSAVGPNPDNPSAIVAFNLKFDPDWAAGLSDDDLRSWIASRAKPLRQVRVNAAPCLSLADEVPTAFLGGLDLGTIQARGARLRSNQALRVRLLAALADTAVVRDEAEHVEEQIYAGFPSSADQVLMERYHHADWPERVTIVEQLTDARLRYHGRRLIHEERPDLLHADVRQMVEAHLRDRLLMHEAPKGKWTSIPGGLSAAAEMLEGCDNQCNDMLAGYTAHFEELMGAYAGG